ncbi:hypothetical protein ACWERY_05655 [Streptomyces sp. NPDC004082]|uniref:hypothetical protein n=1 Tax=unclassified Streptomyces TaxID=2593676 RepID=UPI0033BAADDC
MNSNWRTGSIKLMPGYTLIDGAEQAVEQAEGVKFMIEGGFVNVQLPGAPHTQLVSAPAVRLITCTT